MNPMLEISTLERQFELLVAEYPELAEDEELRGDVFEGQTDIDGVLTRIVRKANDAAAFVVAIQTEREMLHERKERYAKRYEAMRALALRIMDHAGLRKKELPIATLSVRAGVRSVVITDEPGLPVEFLRVIATTHPDKTAIKEALQSGQVVPGATLSNGAPSLSVRVK